MQCVCYVIIRVGTEKSTWERCFFLIRTIVIHVCVICIQHENVNVLVRKNESQSFGFSTDRSSTEKVYLATEFMKSSGGGGFCLRKKPFKIKCATINVKNAYVSPKKTKCFARFKVSDEKTRNEKTLSSRSSRAINTAHGFYSSGPEGSFGLRPAATCAESREYSA